MDEKMNIAVLGAGAVLDSILKKATPNVIFAV